MSINNIIHIVNVKVKQWNVDLITRLFAKKGYVKRGYWK